MTSIHADATRHADSIAALANGVHDDPFAVLGPHTTTDGRFVRTIQPRAKRIDLIVDGNTAIPMEKVHDAGVFVAELPARKRRYHFRIEDYEGHEFSLDDAYRFPSTLGEFDLYLLGEGSDKKIYDKLGAHRDTVLGVGGVRFAVWAPSASRVSVVGDFNHWDGRCHVMRRHPGNGLWDIFVPGLGNGTTYKYEVTDANGELLPLKADPYGHFFERPPNNATIVFDSEHKWRDAEWLKARNAKNELDGPVSIYEVHLGSWRRKDSSDSRYLTYSELADELVPYVRDLGFTHIELLPVSEHPFDGSWGYQPIGLFAPTSRFGNPDDFRYFVDCCHEAGLRVIVDWVPAHFPRDEHGLGRFDGTALYEHEDPRKGAHADWGTLIFNFGRREVVNYLIGSALYWIDEFHIDGIRVDAVASMLYLDYSRKDGEWEPNEHGGNENLEAVEFLKRFNTEIHEHGATSFAEESTTWPGVSRPVDQDGLGFTFKWNMGWMNDTLSYMSEDPVHRRYHHDKVTFGLVYAFTENFVLPLSHDEVVHGKRSLIGRMPGDDWQQFANLRAYYASMYGHPGKKLLFMGSEIAQHIEWNHDRSLDWHLLQYAPHAGVQQLIRDLNRVYRETPALFEIDFGSEGFEWIDQDDRDRSIFSWLRRDRHGNYAVVICNMTPVVRENYRVGLPAGRALRVLINTDDERYGGSGVEPGGLYITDESHHGRPHFTDICLPPLATLILGGGGD